VDVQAGTNTEFILTHAEHKRYERRVKAAQLIEKDTNPDTKKYLMLLYSSAANLLSFAGYTPEKVYDAVKGQQQMKLI
jgi:hypothetical protein